MVRIDDFFDTRTFTVPRVCRQNESESVQFSTEHRLATTVITVRGEIDASNAHLLTDYAAETIAPGRSLIVDLSGLEFLAVAGLRALISIRDQCARAGAVLVLVTSESVDLLLDVTDQTQPLPARPSLAAALEFVRATTCGDGTEPAVTPPRSTRC